MTPTDSSPADLLAEAVEALEAALDVIEELGNYLNDTDQVDEEMEGSVNPKIFSARTTLTRIKESRNG